MKTAMKRLYVLVNPKLNTVYGCVQGGHAVAQFMLEHPDQDWNNQFLIYLYGDPYVWKRILKRKGVSFSVFKEDKFLSKAIKKFFIPFLSLLL